MSLFIYVFLFMVVTLMVIAGDHIWLQPVICMIYATGWYIGIKIDELKEDKS